MSPNFLHDETPRRFCDSTQFQQSDFEILEHISKYKYTNMPIYRYKELTKERRCITVYLGILQNREVTPVL